MPPCAVTVAEPLLPPNVETFDCAVTGLVILGTTVKRLEFDVAEQIPFETMQ
ncbi:hypothetical protein D3C86_1942770 [compost metagenome]